MKIYLMALLWAMLFFASTTRGQTPLIYECKGEGDNNLADFVITNLLPQGFEGCAPIDCNPYFVSSREVEGQCFSHEWHFNNELSTEQRFSFCKSFENLQHGNLVKHKVRIDKNNFVREFEASCLFRPSVCCNINLQLGSVTKEVIEVIDNQKFCLVSIEETMELTSVKNYKVETLTELIYNGTTPQGQYRVPCGNEKDILCLTATGFNEECKETKCIFLNDIQGSQNRSVENDSKISKSQDKSISLKCFPNPTNQILNVNLVLPEGESGSLQLINMLGQTLIELPVETTPFVKSIDLSQYTEGTYLVIYKNQNKAFVAEKIILMKN